MKKFLFLMLVAFVCAATCEAKQKVADEEVVYQLTPAPVCENCVNKITGNLRFEKGVKNVSVNLDTKSVTITYAPDKTDKAALAQAIKKIGYTAVEPACCTTGETPACCTSDTPAPCCQ